MKEVLKVEDDSLLPTLREKDIESIPSIVSAKRKAGDGDQDQVMEDKTTTKGKGKRGKKNDGAAAATAVAAAKNADKPQLDITAMIPFLTPDHLAPPKLPTKEEMDAVLLDLRKRALLQEYVNDA